MGTTPLDVRLWQDLAPGTCTAAFAQGQDDWGNLILFTKPQRLRCEFMCVCVWTKLCKMFKCKTKRNPCSLDGSMNGPPWHSVWRDGILPFVRDYVKVKRETPGYWDTNIEKVQHVWGGWGDKYFLTVGLCLCTLGFIGRSMETGGREGCSGKQSSTLEYSNGWVREALRTAQEDRDIAQQNTEQSSGRVGLSIGRTAALLIKRDKILVSKIMVANAPIGIWSMETSDIWSSSRSLFWNGRVLVGACSWV